VQLPARPSVETRDDKCRPRKPSRRGRLGELQRKGMKVGARKGDTKRPHLKACRPTRRWLGARKVAGNSTFDNRHWRTQLRAAEIVTSFSSRFRISSFGFRVSSAGRRRSETAHCLDFAGHAQHNILFPWPAHHLHADRQALRRASNGNYRRRIAHDIPPLGITHGV